MVVSQMKQNTDLRLHPRYKTSEAAELSGADLASPCEGSVVDISLGGCRVRTKRPLQVGLLLSISILGSLAATVPGEVRYVEESDGEFTTGVKFCPSNHAERMTLARAVFTINQKYWAW